MLFTLAGQLSARMVALVFYAVLARSLGPEHYGDYGFGMAVGTLVVVLMEPGLNLVLVRDGARQRDVLEERLAQLLGYKLSALLVVWPAIVLGTWLLGYRDAALVAVLFAGGTVLVGAFEDLSAAALTAMERLDLEGSLRFASKLLVAGPGILAVMLGGSFAQVLGAITLGAATTGAVGLVLVRRAGLRVRVAFEPRAVAGQIAVAWPMAVHGVLWLVTLRLDQVLASLLGVGHESLGEYNAAVKLVEALVLFPTAVIAAFQPVLSRAWVQGREACSEQISSATMIVLALCVPVATGGALLSGGIASFVYGEAFVHTPALLSIQLAALPFIGLQFVWTIGIVVSGELRAQATATAANLGVNVAVNLLLVPRVGIEGACWAALAGGAAGALVQWALLRRVGLRMGLRGAWRPLVASAAMAAAVLLVRDRLPLVLSITAGALAYALAFAAVGGLRYVRALVDARRAGPAPAPAADPGDLAA